MSVEAQISRGRQYEHGKLGYPGGGNTSMEAQIFRKRQRERGSSNIPGEATLSICIFERNLIGLQ